MGFVVCTCGERISDTVQPNQNEGRYASGFVFDDYGDGTAEELELATRQIWECPVCGALIVDVGHGTVRHYASSDNAAIGLFNAKTNTLPASLENG